MPPSQKSILLVADPIIPVPPVTYGGVERIVSFLAEGLQDRGWEVELFCSPESTCRVDKILYPADNNQWKSRLKNMRVLGAHLLKSRHDLVHSFAHFDMMVPLWPLGMNIVQSFQAMPDSGSFAKRTRIVPRRHVTFTTCGYHMVEKISKVAPTRAIHNGILIGQFDYQPTVASDAPLVFLGRIEPIKGTHTAIQVAKATGRDLVIAGNRSNHPVLSRYFTEKIEPHLSDKIRYVGMVNDIQKNQLLGNAAALLMPIEWDEPFGIVMAEALACGTPVIGFGRGAVPEIVEDGVTGACCSTTEEITEAIRNLDKYSRLACRASAVRRFSADIIVDQYVDLYQDIFAGR